MKGLWTAFAYLLFPTLAFASSSPSSGGPGLGDLSPLWIIPFAGLLLSIAIVPMVAGSFWHHTKNQLGVALAWAAPVLGYLLYLWATDHGTLGHEAHHGLLHALEEYASFIALLGSLYVISGGILLRGDLEGKPMVNATFLAIGAVLANIIGTTGASMLLIRPMLRTNSTRRHVWHIPLFFIFIVSNVGGALTPIGDPPLFLGYLRGVPFWWTFTHLWSTWLVTISALLLMFYAMDRYQFAKETPSAKHTDRATIEPLGLSGNINMLLLAGVIGSVLFLSPSQHAAGGFDPRNYYARELAMGLLTLLSVVLTTSSIRARNDFNYGPILEVAALFIGIFICMVPATAMLNAHGADLGITEPWQYFWATGSLSAFLDNAPTYVTFASVACGIDPTCISDTNLLPLTTGASTTTLMAISLGSVFLGAGSYIGNGPNLMVRSIAERAGYDMPSFFGYIGYAVLFLVPLFAVVSYLRLVVFA